MGQVLLVRHGQASFGSDDYDALSDLGFEQSRLLGRALAARGITPGTVVTGTMRRHRETAEACAEAAGWDIEPVVDEGWDEFDFLAILRAHEHEAPQHEPSRAEFQRWFEEATAQWVAGAERGYAETFAQFTSRVGEALARAAAYDGTVAVFTSGGPIAWAVSTLLVDGGSSDVWRRLNRMAVNSAVTRLISGRRGVNLLSFNEQSHLDGVPGAVSYR